MSSNGGLSGSGGASADEMSVELSEGEGDGDNSNVEMGGMGTDGIKEVTTLKPKLKRKMKEDNYDKEDPFVDDSELAWEEQAAASKDGFFVYSGPLVPEGEKPQVERYGPVPFLHARNALCVYQHNDSLSNHSSLSSPPNPRFLYSRYLSSIFDTQPFLSPHHHIPSFLQSPNYS